MNFRKFVKCFIPKKLFQKIEQKGHLVEAILFNIVYLFPFRGLKVIGITGTNGKTTTALIIHRMLQDAGYKCGLMTTVNYGFDEDLKSQPFHMTTVAVPLLISRVKEMKKKGMDYLILETTSHALAQNRVWGIPFSIAVLTNITHEHISYHGTFDNYVAAKEKLFKLTNKNKKGLRAAVLNAEDLLCERFSKDVKNIITYGVQDGELRASSIQYTPTGSTFRVKYKDRAMQLSCNIPGSFNVYNSLAAAGVGVILGLSDEQIENGIAHLTNVEGRMTSIKEAKDFNLIVDYAHSPDSFEKLFKYIKPLVEGRLIIMFGSLGGGDIEKRFQQGNLAGTFGDIVVLCEEDDRQEDGDKIIEDIAIGARKAGKIDGKDLLKIHNRAQAIQFVVNMAQKNDTVLLLGKGHEKTIEHADGEHSWNEIEEAKKALRNRVLFQR